MADSCGIALWSLGTYKSSGSSVVFSMNNLLRASCQGSVNHEQKRTHVRIAQDTHLLLSTMACNDLLYANSAAGQLYKHFVAVEFYGAIA